MSSGHGTCLESASTRVRWRRSIAVLLLAAMGLGGWMVCRGVNESLEAERNLHATNFAIRLVEQFVAERGRWPGSWGELENLATDDVLFGAGWPSASVEVRDRVEINFRVDVGEIAGQDPMEFAAIQPIGPYYEYRDYPYLARLQTTVRESLSRADAH